MVIADNIPDFFSTTNWQVFTERMGIYFIINDVPEEKKAAVMLAGLTEDIYQILHDICHPQKPLEMDYSELCELLERRFGGKKTVYRERQNFYNAMQGSDESVSAWFARIKSLSIDCKFNWYYCDEVLRDRFISGLKPSAVLDRLCEQPADKLAARQALEIAVATECAV